MEYFRVVRLCITLGIFLGVYYLQRLRLVYLYEYITLVDFLYAFLENTSYLKINSHLKGTLKNGR